MSLSLEDKKKIFITYVTYICSGMMSISVGSIMPDLKESRMLTYAFVGTLVSAHSAGNLFSSFVFGFVAKKYGYKKTMIFFDVFAFIAYAMIAFTNGMLSLIVAFFLTGVARGAITNFNNAEMNKSFHGNAAILNALHGMFAIGAFTFPIIFSFIMNRPNGSFQKTLVFLIIVSIFQLLLFFLYPQTNENENDTRDNIFEENLDNDFSFIRKKEFVLPTMILFFYLCAEQGTIGWLVTYFKDTGFLPSEFSQYTASLQWGSIFLGRMVVAFCSTKINMKKLYLSMGIGFVVFCVLLLFSRNPFVILLGIAGFGFSMAGIYPSTVSIFGKTIMKYELAWSFMLTIAAFGAIIMPIIIGAIASSMGMAFGMSTILIAIIIDFILMVMAVPYIKK